MTQAEYDRVAGDLMALAAKIEADKRPGYTVGAEDVLANFKSTGVRAHITTEQAWTVHFLKHIDAILAIMTRPDLPVSEAPPGRFADLINYTRLGFAIYSERAAAASTTSGVTPKPAPAGATPSASKKRRRVRSGRRR